MARSPGCLHLEPPFATLTNRRFTDAADPSSVTSTGEPNSPSRLALLGNHPNPFNPRTQIRFELPTNAGHITLRVYDAEGRLVRTLVDGELPAGPHDVAWDGRGAQGRRVASGVYHYRLRTAHSELARSMVLLK